MYIDQMEYTCSGKGTYKLVRCAQRWHATTNVKADDVDIWGGEGELEGYILTVLASVVIRQPGSD